MDKKTDLTIGEAFAQVLASPTLWARTGLSANRKRDYRYEVKNGTGPTMDKQLAVIALAGLVVQQPLLFQWDE